MTQGQSRIVVTEIISGSLRKCLLTRFYMNKETCTQWNQVAEEHRKRTHFQMSITYSS